MLLDGAIGLSPSAFGRAGANTDTDQGRSFPAPKLRLLTHVSASVVMEGTTI